MSLPSRSVQQGVLRVVTYNIAGLPEGLSKMHPRTNLPLIGALLDRYDLALIQEDFAYPELLRQRVVLPFGTPPYDHGWRPHFGDGLSQFGKLPFSAPERTPWELCNGVLDAYYDCLTPKGMMFTRVQLDGELSLDVYNVHLDAGASAADRQARSSQLRQLTQAILSKSAGRPILLGGDFNLTSVERREFADFEQAVGVKDVCAVLHCGDPWRFDRILIRSTDSIRLTPRRWSLDLRFHDSKGRPLSDHFAVTAEIGWQLIVARS